MRIVLLLAALSTLIACSDGVTRWDGPGCQPACQAPHAEGVLEELAVCLDEDHQPESCNEAGANTVTCPGNAASVTCDSETGLPTCDGVVARPYCAN